MTHINRPVLSVSMSSLLMKLQLDKLLHVLSMTNLLTIAWILFIYWNERTIFARAVDKCNWHRWENWPADSSPHHLALIADPQLVDPHTYPGRPWPLSTLTVKYTDAYLRRVHRRIQTTLYPDTTVFLGDLFDGGREWSTPHSHSPDKRYRKYRDSFWHKEYMRFASIFFDGWLDAGVAGRAGQTNRRQILSNLPGNHDLGFASGIQEPVRNRFNAYFGDGSTINIIGNHTFVSLDTVSLSAKDDQLASESLWKPAQRFLDDFPDALQRVVVNHRAMQQYMHGSPTYRHEVVRTEDLESATLPRRAFHKSPPYPTILLTHVPLYREPGTPCGPLREKWPQSRDSLGKLLDVDHQNAIAVQRGYQYQNVLSEGISKEIASKLENISYAFSGDDHDYCEVIHRRYRSAGAGIREITVKSVSCAMGVRRPGLQLVSLWNPAHVHQGAARSAQTSQTPSDTLQTSLCLLPDQLGIFIAYARLLALTFLLVGARATCLMANPKLSRFGASFTPILPLAQTPNPYKTDKAQSSSSDDGTEGSVARSRLAVRSDLLRGSNVSPKPSLGYGLPSYESKSSNLLVRQTDDPLSLPASTGLSIRASLPSLKTRCTTSERFRLFRMEVGHSILKIALVVFPWYAWLIYNG